MSKTKKFLLSVDITVCLWCGSILVGAVIKNDMPGIGACIAGLIIIIYNTITLFEKEE